jgi:hypothetical protein
MPSANLCGSDRINAHPFAIFAEFLIGYNAVNLGVEGIITAQTHIGAGMNSGAELTDKDIAGLDHLAAESFYPTPLGITVSAVL